ncbi:LOW QUALITY PROTEIN: hypothetical protein Cgig2_023861 [Carnegiea gigantea]|uniref:Reverse transcriptase n=1 Tax=Carnegiea gigantea TaxID=171969 RepID=A0A9Q1GPD1_9CARY|nr:LOW QUALITY PROTEIN: hypothetical protein Cgig2_023861 [Carnegiea gigantea]
MVEVRMNGARGWLIMTIYTSPHTSTREELWEKLEERASSINCPWLLTGDFNKTRSLEERDHGGPFMARRAQIYMGTGSLHEHKEECQAGLSPMQHVLEIQGETPGLPPIGPHTYSYIHSGFTKRLEEDKPFRFQAAWMPHAEFENLIKDKWRTQTPVHVALDALANQLNEWNREIFGNLFRKKRKIWGQIEGIQRKLEEEGPRYMLKLKRKLRICLDEITKPDELQSLVVEFYKDLFTEGGAESSGYNDNAYSTWGTRVRALRELNSASMVKIGWWMIHDPNALWVRVLRYKHPIFRGRWSEHSLLALTVGYKEASSGDASRVVEPIYGLEMGRTREISSTESTELDCILSSMGVRDKGGTTSGIFPMQSVIDVLRARAATEPGKMANPLENQGTTEDESLDMADPSWGHNDQ